VAAAADVGAKAGARRLVTFDMGGTSTDVALLEDGACALASEAVVHGYPIKARMLDINTVGAGGGSIAFVDGGGLMKVGPRSAGAVPGPACYGKGGAEATVTDANLVLGMLNPSHLLGGRMAVRADLAAAAIGALGAALGLDPLRAADGILTVVTANMARAVRVISVQRGRDLRDFALIAFGGAGPLHAARLARELGIKTILVPRSPGALCAEGLVTSAVRTSFSKTKSMTLSPEAAPLVAAAFTELLARAEPWFLSEGVGAAEQDLARSIDIRYRGQNFELEVPYPEAETTPASLERLANRFEELHEQRYGFAARGDPIQLVTFRLEAKGRAPPPLAKAEALRGEDPSDALVGRRAVWFSEACGFTATPVYERDRLGAGARLAGPAVVEQFDSTTLIPPGMTARVDPYLTLVLEDR
jgi:N-methylhydantoinase A